MAEKNADSTNIRVLSFFISKSNQLHLIMHAQLSLDKRTWHKNSKE